MGPERAVERFDPVSGTAIPTPFRSLFVLVRGLFSLSKLGHPYPVRPECLLAPNTRSNLPLWSNIRSNTLDLSNTRSIIMYARTLNRARVPLPRSHMMVQRQVQKPRARTRKGGGKSKKNPQRTLKGRLGTCSHLGFYDSKML